MKMEEKHKNLFVIALFFLVHPQNQNNLVKHSVLLALGQKHPAMICGALHSTAISVLQLKHYFYVSVLNYWNLMFSACTSWLSTLIYTSYFFYFYYGLLKNCINNTKAFS